jgi:hypothetical protein
MSGPAGPAGLRRFVSPAPPAPGPSPSPAGTDPALPIPGTGDAARPPDPETCEMCGAGIPAEHGHVADLERSALLCTCRACYLLFTHSGAGLTRSPGGAARSADDPAPSRLAGSVGPGQFPGDAAPSQQDGATSPGGSRHGAAGAAVRGRYRAVPDRYLHDPERPMTAAEWDDLEIPVGLAFFLRSSQRDEVSGFYPSPAGVTECRLDLAAWERIAGAHPLLRAMDTDVEAALICRTDDGIEHFLVPVDICYELAGRMRLTWRGFDGGTEARQAIADFLDRVRSLARPLPRES